MRLRTGDPLAIVDIGAGGALVESNCRLLPGTAVGVHLAGAGGAVSMDARVVRCCVCALDLRGGIRYRGALEFVQERGP
jgi:hypothetical protein